jgi:uncharacterized membrane protein
VVFFADNCAENVLICVKNFCDGIHQIVSSLFLAGLRYMCRLHIYCVLCEITRNLGRRWKKMTELVNSARDPYFEKKPPVF